MDGTDGRQILNNYEYQISRVACKACVALTSGYNVVHINR